MKSLNIILGLLRRGLIWLLILYWAAFVGYTIKNFWTGGLNAVVGWYMHINGDLVQWRWGRFIAGQASILGLSVALFVSRGRNPVEYSK